MLQVIGALDCLSRYQIPESNERCIFWPYSRHSDRKSSQTRNAGHNRLLGYEDETAPSLCFHVFGYVSFYLLWDVSIHVSWTSAIGVSFMFVEEMAVV